jgi:hypothetical protein
MTLRPARTRWRINERSNLAPVIVGNGCITNFTATEPGPGGKIYYNKVEFDTVAVQGGILCANDGSMSGTTPFRVFIKAGVVRRSR